MMKAMRLQSGLLLLLAGCWSAPASTSGTVEPGLPPPVQPPPLGDRHEFGPLESVKPGTWARYRVTRGRVEQELTLGVIEHSGGRTWFEVVEEGEPRRASRRLVADGTIEKALYREVPSEGAPSAIAWQPIVQSGPPPRVTPPTSTESVAGEETVRGVRAPVTIDRLLFRDDELGREYREEHAWSPQLPPIFAGAESGGLVRRETPAERVQLVDFGEGYKPLIPAPPE